MVRILQKDAGELRKKSQKVTQKNFGSKELLNVIKKMENALESQDDGVALAAPQIGVNLRIFVISWKVYALKDGIRLEGIDEDEFKNIKSQYKNKVFINPEIIKTSKDTEWLEEGCLSVRPIYGKVLRAKKCKIKAQDVHGDFFEVGGSGIIAQIFQHEIDHLNGILFTDKAENIQEINN